MVRRARTPLLGFAALLACGHALEAGTWQIHRDPSTTGTVDTCGLLPAGGSLSGGPLTIAGNYLHFSYGLLATGASTEMVGRFKTGKSNEPEAFDLFGSVSNADLAVRGGVSCTIAFGQIAIDGIVDGSSAFHGQLTIHLDFVRSQAETCPLACDATTGVRAERVAP